MASSKRPGLLETAPVPSYVPEALQFFTVYDGKWISATPLLGSYIINIGELMKRWTNGRFKATVHRVVHLRNMPRYSMPLFCNPNFRTIVDPRDLGVSDD